MLSIMYHEDNKIRYTCKFQSLNSKTTREPYLSFKFRKGFHSHLNLYTLITRTEDILNFKIILN